MDTTNFRRRPAATQPRRHPGDPALAALTELLVSEREQALREEAALVEQCDAGRVWFLWFAIGATDAICTLVRRDAESERNQLFRHVVSLIFSSGVRSEIDPVLADRDFIEHFETAGARAVEACMRGDPRLGYYVTALRKMGRRYN